MRMNVYAIGHAVDYRIRSMTRLLTGLVFAVLSSTVSAQSWPLKPVRIIAPFAPGGSADTLGRVVAQKLTESFKQNFVIENRPGAGGAIGSELVARAAPDGYTLVVSGVASHAIAPSLPRGTPYDPLKDFTHIALFGGPPAVLVVNPSVPAKDLKEFVALLKKEPGKYSYGSPGNGTHGQLVAELFKQLAGVQMQHVPYKGAAIAISDLMAGHIPVASTTLTTAAGQIHAGKARALAISSEARLPDYPDVPTYAEMGYKELVATVWFSLSGPANLPQDIVERLNAEVRKALDAPDTRQRLRPEGIEPGTLNPREFAAFVEAELKRWAPVVKASGTKTD
jgi:tripartite-type tricarboxylate transporter receptor subunit TctC